MTTSYTSTVGLTTLDAALSNFTINATGLGINVYDAAEDVSISQGDIGPTTDSNILLQTHAVGGHHLFNLVLHDSHTPTGPTYGTHGIYDKAFDSLVENCDFHNHPNGQGYSPRYANRCKSCTFHTQFAIAAFNYQDSGGQDGVLRLRDHICYDPYAPGYVFYTDGTWRAADGTLLGDSLWTYELDHFTCDVRGMAEPFDFTQCHNDVYLTNSIIISDSGLPLSSIIRPPTDGSTVHLDGSIVLSSADAATYLTASPAFVPIDVGGSPIIGMAGDSPPGCFAAWGNAADVGAVQTGIDPPPPPGPPGPSPDPPPPPPIPTPTPGPTPPFGFSPIPVFSTRFRAADGGGF